jgi:hypothetical protein
MLIDPNGHIPKVGMPKWMLMLWFWQEYTCHSWDLAGDLPGIHSKG